MIALVLSLVLIGDGLTLDSRLGFNTYAAHAQQHRLGGASEGAFIVGQQQRDARVALAEAGGRACGTAGEHRQSRDARAARGGQNRSA